MIDKEEKPFFSFVCKTEEDIKLEINKQISELVESQQSEFKFNNETLYKLGNGHSFCYGFFTEYLTKTGVSARHYVNGRWHINGIVYSYINSEFIKMEKKERKPNTIGFEGLLLPIKKNDEFFINKYS